MKAEVEDDKNFQYYYIAPILASLLQNSPLKSEALSEKRTKLIEKNVEREEKKLIKLKNLVIQSIKNWVLKLTSPLQQLCDFYYNQLSKSPIVDDMADENLSEEEKQLLESVRNFNVKNLDLYKDTTQEEDELLKLIDTSVPMSPLLEHSANSEFSEQKSSQLTTETSKKINPNSVFARNNKDNSASEDLSKDFKNLSTVGGQHKKYQ